MAAKTNHSDGLERQSASRLLIVEDDAAQLKTLSAIMRTRGFEVDSCRTASEGMAHFDRDGADVVVLDLHLPDASGMDVLRKLAADSGAPIILHTAYSSFETARDAVNLGAFAYVEKGGDPNELVHHVHRAMEARLHRRAEDLEDAVAERTRELQRANEALKQEIAERKRLEERLQEERDFAEGLIATAQAIVLVLDTEGRIVRFNPYMEAISGYRLDEVRGNDWFSTFLPRRDHEHIRKLFLRAINDIQTRGNVNAIVTKDGRERRIEWCDKALKDEKGNIVGLLSIGQDITEREETAEALRESEMMTRSLLEGSPVCNKIIDLDSKLRYMSAAGLRQLKIPDIEPYLGQTYPPEFYPEAMRAPLVKGLKLAMAGEISSVEAPAHDTEGNEIWYHTTFVPARDNDGPVKYVIASSVDITDRKRAEEAANAATRQSAQVLLSSPAVIYSCRIDPPCEPQAPHPATFVSENIERVLGCKSEECLSDPAWWFEHLHPEDTPRASANMTRLFTEGRLTHEYRIRHKDGSYRWVLDNVVLITDAAGKPTEIVGSWTDVSQRREAEEALRESARFNEQIIASTREGVIVYGPDLKYQVWNPFMEELTGFSADEVLGRHPLEVFPFLREAGVVERFDRALAGEIPETAEFPYDLQKTGRKGWVSDTSGPLRDANGEIIGVINIVRDITEQKLAEEQYLHAQKMEAIGLLAGGVAHDFRNQLTIILGYAERLLRRSLVSDEGRRAAEEIINATQRSATLSGQLLAFSRREILRPEVVDLNELIADMAKTLPQMLGEDIHITTVFGCPSCRASLDENQLQQAILNLVVNARHAMPAGGKLVIEISAVEADASFCKSHAGVTPGSYVALSVADTGCGMDAETLQKVFDPFFTTREVGEGTGLGLSMVYGFVKQSGGAVEVDSEPGKGSVFRLYFPRSEGAAAPRDDTQAPEGIPRGDETILVVEDEEPVRQMLVMNLREFGYTVIEAGNAAEALPLAEHYEGRIDILVTDFVMPGMNGGQLARRVRQARPGIPVLCITGYKGADLAKRGLEGVDRKHLLIKPFSVADLARSIRSLLDKAKAPAKGRPDC